MSLQVLEYKNLTVEKQLAVEKQLLKEKRGSFCLISRNISSSALVLGASNKKEKWVNLELLHKKPIALVRRFSGGGAIVADEDTFFVSFIIEKKLLHFSFPEELFAWSEKFYRKVFSHPDFALKERDYVFKDRKCGGNAQYFTKDKWLHHTSFLFDFKQELMDYLLEPETAPVYRGGRLHSDFLVKIQGRLFPSQKSFLGKLKKELKKEFSCIFL